MKVNEHSDLGEGSVCLIVASVSPVGRRVVNDEEEEGSNHAL